MSRFRNRRSGWLERSTDPQRDPYSSYRNNQDDRTWGLSPSYRERFGHATSYDSGRRYVPGEEYNPNRISITAVAKTTPDRDAHKDFHLTMMSIAGSDICTISGLEKQTDTPAATAITATT